MSQGNELPIRIVSGETRRKTEFSQLTVRIMELEETVSKMQEIILGGGTHIDDYLANAFDDLYGIRAHRDRIKLLQELGHGE